MTTAVSLSPAGGTWVVRAGGAVIGESTNAMSLIEGNLPPVIYFPRADMAMAFLEPTGSRTACPHKGEANYFSIVTKSKTLADAAWSYENPKDDLAGIAGHLAFYVGPDVTVEQL